MSENNQIRGERETGPQQGQEGQKPSEENRQQPSQGSSSGGNTVSLNAAPTQISGNLPEGRPVERTKGEGRKGARGTAAMDPSTRQEVARKGGLAVSRNRQHMAEIGRKGGQTVSKNREHMASIGRKGGEASRGHR
jgi:general stress protein YciG